MDKEDLLLIFLVVFLLTAILVTIFFGGNQSRHGYGLNIPMPSDIILIPLCMSVQGDIRPANWACEAFGG